MGLLNIQAAADALGYKVKGLRKIVERSRAKANGARTRGPTIKFFQSTKGAPIMFRPEWIEKFIDDHTVDPGCTSTRNKPREYTPSETFGLDERLFDV